MKVTYLNHSGFLLEWEHSYWIFDYYRGTLPKLDPSKDILVFCSHSHHDHFNPEIFTLLEDYPSTIYIFSNETRHTCRRLEQDIHFFKSRTDNIITTTSGETLCIHTLRSTDCGCAFFIEYHGKTIYHAGDLHWWHWDGEEPSWNKQMESNYKKEIDYLKDKKIDLAFTPLDPRQEKDYALGMNYFLENTLTNHVFPMHFWNDFNIITQYQQEFQIPETTFFHPLQYDGQSFEIML